MSQVLSEAEVLNQALPYIQRFRGQTFVIKYGGSVMRDPDLRTGVIRNVLLLQLVGIRPILVHGGGPEIDRWFQRLGLEKQVVGGLRRTDDEAMEIVEMALSGRANKALVSEMQRCGGKAIGLSGRDGGMLLAEPISEELGRVGRVTHVEPEILRLATEAGFIPVVGSVASDSEGEPLNVNADSAAAAIAAAVKASKLILLTDANGVLSDPSDPRSTLSQLGPSEAQGLIRSGKASAGMIPKLEAAIEALEQGVERVHLIHGGLANALLIEIFTDQGIGTMLLPR